MKKSLDQVESLATQACEELGCRLYLLEWNPQCLQIYVDKKNSSINSLECEQLSRRINFFLNDLSVQMEVSSPGIERKLKYPWHFTEAIGKNIRVNTLKSIKGQKRFTGCLTKASEEEIFLENPDCMFRIPFQEIQKANIIYQVKNQKIVSGRSL